MKKSLNLSPVGRDKWVIQIDACAPPSTPRVDPTRPPGRFPHRRAGHFSALANPVPNARRLRPYVVLWVSQAGGTRARAERMAHVLFGEPGSTSPEHALIRTGE